MKFVKEVGQPQLALQGNDVKRDDFKNTGSYWFIFMDSKLLVTSCDTNRYSIPKVKAPEAIGLFPIRTQYIGTYNNICCFSAEIISHDQALPREMEFLNLLTLHGRIESDMLHIAFYAVQVVAWDRDFQFCGRCGARNGTMDHERAKLCPTCNLISYPRISSAIIVAIVRDHSLLLARSNKFKHPNMYSVLAGFVEPGETLEECVAREVREEVSIEVQNIRYFGSQSWPFPDSLMVGFTAEYARGTIQVDAEEITEAAWFSVSELPQIPSSISISRQLIDWFIERERHNNKGN